MRETPAYIVLEGPDGCGKTTQMRLLQQAFTDANLPFVPVREPGSVGIGQPIREILLTGAANKLDGITEVLLFSADRHHSLVASIRPALAEGKCVLSDRNYLSTHVFQGHARGLPLEKLEELTRFAMEGTQPDLILILDIPTEVSLARKNVQHAATAQAAAGPVENRFESIGDSFQKRVRQGYLAEAAKHPDLCEVIDASQAAEAVHKAILSALNTRLGFSFAV